MENEEIGRRIRERRKAIGISAVELAARLSMSKATIHRYENGSIHQIKLPVIESIARELKVNPLWLIGKSDTIDLAPKEELDEFDLVSIIDRLLAFVRENDNLTAHGRRITDEQKRMFTTGLKLTRGMLDKFE